MARGLGNRKQFVNGFSVGQDGHGSSTLIEEALMIINARNMFDGDPKVIGCECSFKRLDYL